MRRERAGFWSFVSFMAIILIGLALLIAAIVGRSEMYDLLGGSGVPGVFMIIANAIAYLTLAFLALQFAVTRLGIARLWCMLVWLAAIVMIVVAYVLMIV